MKLEQLPQPAFNIAQAAIDAGFKPRPPQPAEPYIVLEKHNGTPRLEIFVGLRKAWYFHKVGPAVWELIEATFDYDNESEEAATLDFFKNIFSRINPISLP